MGKWVIKHTLEYEMFWHITARSKVDSIIKRGLEQSISGINGDGVYCIKQATDDSNCLDNVSNFMGRNDLPRAEQFIVAFEYLGPYYQYETGSTAYEEEGWVHIQADIEPRYIDSIFHIRDV